MEVEGALEGRELTNISDEEIKEASIHNDVFARTSPTISCVSSKGYNRTCLITSMTGDGVNDAQPLNELTSASRWESKGQKSPKRRHRWSLSTTTLKRFTMRSVKERRVYDNLKKTILFLLPTNGDKVTRRDEHLAWGDGTTQPGQILWVNMVVAITLSLAIASSHLRRVR